MGPFPLPQRWRHRFCEGSQLFDFMESYCHGISLLLKCTEETRVLALPLFNLAVLLMELNLLSGVASPHLLPLCSDHKKEVLRGSFGFRLAVRK